MTHDAPSDSHRSPTVEWRVPDVADSWSEAQDLLALPWADIPAVSLVLADGTGPPVQGTRVRACESPGRFLVHFDCEDTDIWGTYAEHDDPLYREEAVEVFLAPGDADPVEYYEFEVSPKGVLFDARVRNPTYRREDLVTDAGWDCQGIRSAAAIAGSRWTAAIAIPWSALGVPHGSPDVCRANFYRIDRPKDRDPEFSAWTPTYASPADFHKPSRFGRLRFSGKEKA